MPYIPLKSKIDSPLPGSSSKKRVSGATNQISRGCRDLTPVSVRRHTADVDLHTENLHSSSLDLCSHDLLAQPIKLVGAEVNTPTVKSRGRSCERRRVASDDAGLLLGSETDNVGIVVAVRVRPFTERERKEDGIKCVVSMEDNVTIVRADDRPAGEVYQFNFDHCFWSFSPGASAAAAAIDAAAGNTDATAAANQCLRNAGQSDSGVEYADQVTVYRTLGLPLLDNVFKGYNACLFAYGQTGSGKSYSMMGHGDDAGVIPRFCKDLFTRIENFSDKSIRLNVEMSFFEIYNEKIHDLLASVSAAPTAITVTGTPVSSSGAGSRDRLGKKAVLKVREHPLLGPFVEDLSSYIVRSYDDVNYWLGVGNKRRATAATSMNDSSSRSHSVFTVVLSQTRISESEEEGDRDSGEWSHSVTSKVSLVDLAGSERQSLARTTGDRLREGSMINKSLMTLGKVIVCLAENSAGNKRQKVYIPYRESVLTWLLKESLGGNSKTAMLTTISPSVVHVEETLSALRYASQARRIVNVARINEDPKARTIRALRAEIEKLRRQMDCESPGKGLEAAGDALAAAWAPAGERSPAAADEIARLKEQLLRKELEMKELTRSWEDRLARTEQRKCEEEKLLEKSRLTIGNHDNCDAPNIVNLNADPQLSEILQYVLCEGQTHVGRSYDANSDAASVITLFDSVEVKDRHCLFDRTGEIVKLSAIGNASTYINGDQIDEKPVVLKHGDCINIGGEHFFRFSNPLHSSSDMSRNGKSANCSDTVRDFRDALEEFMVKKNKRLEAELNALRTKHETDLQRLNSEKNQEQELMAKQLAVGEAKARSQLTDFERKVKELEQELEENRKKQEMANHSRVKAELQVDRLEEEKKRLEKEVSRKQQENLEPQINVADDMGRSRENWKNLRELSEQLRRKQSATLQCVVSKPRMFTCSAIEALSMDGSLTSDHYFLKLRLVDANRLARLLHKDLKFSRKDILLNGTTVSSGVSSSATKVYKNTHSSASVQQSVRLIKVLRQAEQTSCFWTVEKFIRNLKILHNLYKGEIEDEMADEIMLEDAEDLWEKEVEEVSGNSPVVADRVRSVLLRVKC